MGVTRVLEAIRLLNPKGIRFQASSSEMFGKVQGNPQSEATPFCPRSPTASEVYGHWITVNYRESYGMFCCSGILFNHESPVVKGIRVTRKGDRRGRPDHSWDWAMNCAWATSMPDAQGSPAITWRPWKMLQADQPDDFVIATGKPIPSSW